MKNIGKIPLIIGAALFITGIIFIILGIPADLPKANGAAFITSDDVQNTPQGKPLKFAINNTDIAVLGEGTYVYAIEDDLYIIMELGDNDSRRLNAMLISDDTEYISLKGNFNELENEKLEYSKTAFYEFLDIMYGDEEVPDSEIDHFLKSLSDRYIKVTAVYDRGVSLGKIAIGGGFALVGIIFILCAFLSIKKRCSCF